MSEDTIKKSEQEQKFQDASRVTYQRSKSLYPLPDVNLNFEFQLKILAACIVTSDYGKRDSNLVLVQSNLVNKSDAIGSGINFLASIGLLTGDKNGFKPSDKAVDFMYARKQEQEEEAKSILAGVIGKAWFAESARQLIEVKGPVGESELINKMARDCRVDTDKRERSFKSLVDYLKYSGIVREQEDQKLAIGQVTVPPQNDSKTRLAAAAYSPKPESGQVTAKSINQFKASSQSSAPPPFVFNFNLDISPDTDAENVRKIIRAIIEELTTGNNAK